MTTTTPTPAPTPAPASCKLAFLDANQKGFTVAVDVESGQQVGTFSTDGLVSPDGSYGLRLIPMGDGTKIALDFLIGLGNQRLVDGITGDVIRAAWSPDSQRAAFVMKVGARQNLYLLTINGVKVERLTDWDQIDDYPAWADAGKMLLFGSQKDGQTLLYVIQPDNKPRSVTQSESQKTIGAGPLTSAVNGTNGAWVTIVDGKPTLIAKGVSGEARSILKADKPILELAYAPDTDRIALSIGGVLHVINADGSGFRPIPGNWAGSQLSWQCGAIPTPNNGGGAPRRG